MMYIIIVTLIIILLFLINYLKKQNKIYEIQLKTLSSVENKKDSNDSKRQIKYNNIVEPYLVKQNNTVIKTLIEEKNIPKIKPITVKVDSIISDSQNVHSHSALETAKKSIDKLNNVTKDIELDDKDIIDKVCNNIDRYDKFSRNRKDIIINMVKNFDDVVLPSVNNSELGVLRLVYIRAENNPDTMEILIKNLNDCRVGNNRVCKTGVIQRILSTLDGIDDDVKILPEWALKQELLNKASILNIEYENLDDKERRENVKNKLIAEYINVISVEELNKEIDKWIDYI